MKIFSIIPNLAGGGGRVLVDLVKSFQSFENAVFYGQPIGGLVFGFHNELDSLGILHRHIPTQYELEKEIEVQKPDIVLYHWWPNAPYRKEKGTIPWIMIIHSLMPAPQGYDFYVPVSKACDLIQSHIPAVKRKIIYNGVDLEHFSTFRSEPHHHFIIGRVSHLYPMKIDVEYVDFLGGLDIPDWKAVIVGSGPMQNVLAQRADELHLRERFEFPGALDHVHIVQQYRRFDLSLFLTRIPENHPIAVLECMAMGIPVVTEPKGGLPEIITHNVNGFMSFYAHDWKRYCELIAKHPDLKERLSSGAIESAKKFDIKIQQAAYNDLLKKMVG